MSSKSTTQLSKESILKNLKDLDLELKKLGKRGEVNLYGGAVMVLVFNARPATKDVDAVFEPKSIMRRAIENVARKNDLPKDWMNDGVKGFLSANDKVRKFIGLPNLTIHVPVPEYLLAMKVKSARVDETDRKDVIFLIRKMGIRTPKEVFDIIDKYYPRREIPAKTQYFIEEVFDVHTFNS